MYIDIVPNRNSPPAVLLRETWREDGRVRKRTIANISNWPRDKVETLRRLLKDEPLVPVQEVLQIQRSWQHGHVAAVLGTLRKLGLERMIDKRRSRERDLVVAMVVARILSPCSKLATAKGLDEVSSLSEVLELGEVEADDLYAAMDWLLKRQPRVEESLARLHLHEGSLVLYDLTSSYFEGRTCSLARIGYSRDGKKNRLQIVFGLLTDPEGRPIAVEVFSGNTADPATLAHQVETLRKRFNLKTVVLVGDRGMITAARIREDLEPYGLEWITSLRGPAIRKLVEQEAIQLSLFDQCDLAEIEEPSYPGERLVVCRNPLLAAERARKRQDLLAATERELDKVVCATTREKRPLRGAGAIGVRVGKVQNRYKMAKHFEMQIDEDNFQYERKEAAIHAESQLDGLYVIRTNVAAERLSAEEAVSAYKSLSQVERAFRCIKTSGLEVRPIYHRLEDRVRAHVFLCTLAYYVEWHLRKHLAPLLFQDHDPAAGAERRTSAVAPAQRSEAAEQKAHTQRTESGQRVHSFRDLLDALSSLTRNQVTTAAAPDLPFVIYTQPTPLQQEAFDLLGLSSKM
jgi:hypothetical protein